MSKNPKIQRARTATQEYITVIQDLKGPTSMHFM